MHTELLRLLRMLDYEVRLQRWNEGERSQNWKQAGILLALYFG